MKNIIKTIPILFLLIVFGCKDDLKETVYTNLPLDGYKYKSSDVYSVIGSVYQNLQQMMGDGFSYHIPIEVCTDQLVLPDNASGWGDPEWTTTAQQHKWVTNGWTNSGMWNYLYKGVVLTNRIIGQLESKVIPIPTGESYESLIAEMKVTRALYYWYIIDNWGDAPFVTSTAQDLPAKTDRATIFNAIIADINYALDNNLLMEDKTAKNYGRINKWGAKALLSNLYLNAEVYTGTAAYEKCLAECNDIIASGKYQLETNYADCFSYHNENSVENISVVIFDEVYATNNDILLYSMHQASKDKYNWTGDNAWGAGGTNAVPQFVDTYDSFDTRLDDTWEHGPQFAADGVTPLLCSYDRKGQQLDYTKDIKNGLFRLEDEGYRLIKYKPMLGMPVRGSNDETIFRFAQVLMMKAECLLRSGQADAAATIVSEVRQRAFKAHPEKATVTGAQLMGDSKYKWGYYATDYALTNGTLDKGNQTPVQYGGMYDELGYEFAGELMRRRDQIRYGTYATKSWLSHQPSDKDIAKTSLVFPIPQSAIDANPNLVQNPGY